MNLLSVRAVSDVFCGRRINPSVLIYFLKEKFEFSIRLGNTKGNERCVGVFVYFDFSVGITISIMLMCLFDDSFSLLFIEDTPDNTSYCGEGELFSSLIA